MSLGEPIPAHLPHAISVSLPTWRDNVDYEEGAKRVTDAQRSGYPRFFIALNIQKVASLIGKRFAAPGEQCMLFPSAKVVEACRAFMLSQGAQEPVRGLQYAIQKPDDASAPPIVLHVVLFPQDAFPLAKAFWQHTGLGISSRMADACLARLSDDGAPSPTGTRSRTARYSVKKPAAPPAVADHELEVEPGLQSTLIEERYGRNLPASAAENAKRVLRRRIAGVLVQDRSSIDDPDVVALLASDSVAHIAPSIRVAEVTEDDVFLLPSGMSAIWTAHQLALATRSSAKSICFGFPYTDTLKILQKWGLGCEFLGHGLDADIDTLDNLLAAEQARNPSVPPALALFCEFPSNPLLRSANLRRLRELADKYDFLIVIDETIGNFANVEVLPYADVVVSSLTKIFSGAVNVMGGSLVLNPHGRHYATLQAHMRATYEDTYWPEDAIYMESNSRNFVRRAHTTNQNTEAVCDFLRAHPAVKDVFYPKWETRANYDACRLRAPLVPEWPTGFGGLFSVTFKTLAASRAFFDALPCAKGPSLGTNFTLACPYTILAHYYERDWAASYGVEEGLVRVSIGLEPVEELLDCARVALKAAEEAMNSV